IHIQTLRGWRFVPYDELSGVILPPKHPTATQVAVRTRHGELLEFPVHADDRTSDAHEFVRFFDRVRGDEESPFAWTHPSARRLTTPDEDPVRSIAALARR